MCPRRRLVARDDPRHAPSQWCWTPHGWPIAPRSCHGTLPVPSVAGCTMDHRRPLVPSTDWTLRCVRRDRARPRSDQLPRQRQHHQPARRASRARPTATAAAARRGTRPRPAPRAPARTSSPGRPATSRRPRARSCTRRTRAGRTRRRPARARAPAARSRPAARAAPRAAPRAGASASTRRSTPTPVFETRDPSITGSQPYSLIGPARATVRIANSAIVTSATSTPGPTIRVSRSDPPEHEAREHDAQRRHRRAERLDRRQRLAAEHDREHHREPAVGRDDRRHDADRPDPERRVEREVGDGRERSRGTAPSRRPAAVPASSSVRFAAAITSSTARLVSCAPASTPTLPTRRAARAPERSVTPHASDARRPKPRPLGIDGV